MRQGAGTRSGRARSRRADFNSQLPSPRDMTRVLPWRSVSLLSAVLWLLAAAPWLASARDTPLLLVLQKKANALGLYDPQSGAHLWNVEVGAKPHEMAL